jgi:hypothetical protein
MSAKPTVVEAISAVMADVQGVRKTDRNTDQGYMFRGIDAVTNAVGPVLRRHGVVVVPVKSTASYRDVLTSRGKPSRECTVSVTYRFYGPAGDFIDAEVPGESMDFGDKGAPKAMSVAYRILLLQALCIPTDDPDPDSHSYERERDERPAVDEAAQREEARQRALAGARAEISFAADREAADLLNRRIEIAASRGTFTAEDVVDLRRLLVARLDELYPSAQDPVGPPVVQEAAP